MEQMFSFSLRISLTVEADRKKVRSILYGALSNAEQGMDFWDLLGTAHPNLKEGLRLIDSDEAFIVDIGDYETGEVIWTNDNA